MSIGHKITQTGEETFVKDEGTLFDGVLAAALAPLGIVTDSDDYHSAGTMALASIGYGIAGVMVGDRWGDSIPLIGGSR